MSGALGVLTGAIFLIFARGGIFRGEPPRLDNAPQVLGNASFWIVALLFALANGAGAGVFSVIPTYFVAELGMGQEVVNTLVGLSRFWGLGVVFVAGYLVERLGARRIMAIVLLLSGVTTAALGLNVRFAIAALFVQPIFVSCFSPAGYAAVSRITDQRLHNVKPRRFVFGMPKRTCGGAPENQGRLAELRPHTRRESG